MCLTWLGLGQGLLFYKKKVFFNALAIIINNNVSLKPTIIINY